MVGKYLSIVDFMELGEGINSLTGRWEYVDDSIAIKKSNILRLYRLDNQNHFIMQWGKTVLSSFAYLHSSNLFWHWYSDWDMQKNSPLSFYSSSSSRTQKHSSPPPPGGAIPLYQPWAPQNKDNKMCLFLKIISGWWLADGCPKRGKTPLDMIDHHM